MPKRGCDDALKAPSAKERSKLARANKAAADEPFRNVMRLLCDAFLRKRATNLPTTESAGTSLCSRCARAAHLLMCLTHRTRHGRSASSAISSRRRSLTSFSRATATSQRSSWSGRTRRPSSVPRRVARRKAGASAPRVLRASSCALRRIRDPSRRRPRSVERRRLFRFAKLEAVSISPAPSVRSRSFNRRNTSTNRNSDTAIIILRIGNTGPKWDPKKPLRPLRGRSRGPK